MLVTFLSKLVAAASLTQTKSNRNTLSQNERRNGLQLHVVTNAFWSLVINPVKKKKKDNEYLTSKR